MPQNRLLNILIAFMGIVPLFSGGFLSAWAIKNETLLRNLSIGQWGIITVVLTVTSAFALTPPTMIAIAMGYFLGWQAIFFLIFLNLIAISLVYFLAKPRSETSSYLNYLSQNQKIKSFIETVSASAWRFVMFAKLSPILPFALTNLLFALLRLPFREVLGGGFIGMLPRTLLAVWVGMEAKALQNALQNSDKNAINQIIIVSLFVISLAGLWRFFIKKTKS